MTDTDDEPRILTILSWNVNGFSSKRSEVLNYLCLLKADVVFLQETHVGPDRVYLSGSFKIQDLEYDYSLAVFTVFRGNSRGVAILFKNSLHIGGFNVDCDEKGRYIIISCQIWGHDFVFINVYNSNEEKIGFTEFPTFSPRISASAYLVVGGDFNTVMDADLDKTSHLRNRSHVKSFNTLQHFLESLSLVDVWRCLYPEVKSFTYFKGKGQSRLDYFFLQSHNLTRITSCNIHERPMYFDKQEYVSDHAPLSIGIQTDGPKWQFDRRLLEDKTCMEQLSSTIKNISQTNTKQKENLWPGVKIRLICEAVDLQKHLELSTSDANEHMDQGGLESSIEVLKSPRTSSQSLLNFLNHLHRSERFDDLNSILISVLTEPVSRREILLAILSLPLSESPTADGLTVRFYKHYACKIIDLLQAHFSPIFDLKPCRLLESLKQGEHDHTYSAGLQRHCSMMPTVNVDHKILALILAERLNGVIEHLLHPGQSKPVYSLQDRISDQGLVISLKLDPAALKWPFIFNSLKSLNLPDGFRSALQLLLMTDQGLSADCPLTPLLNRICLHPLINSINGENRFLGAIVQGETLKSLIDRDRALLFLSDSSEVLDAFEKILKDFTETSGFTVDEVFVRSPSGFRLGKDQFKPVKRSGDRFCEVVQIGS